MDYILEKSLKSIAIVGMAKNVGKTVTLNYLIQTGEREGLKLGLTSIGRDGERLDALSATEKPQIRVVAGTLFATARAALEKTALRTQVIASTGIQTVLGEVFIYQAMDDGEVELVGPHSHAQLEKVIHLMATEVDLILVDGAINRSSSAAPSITNGVILSTGAVIGPNIETVVEKTAYQANNFRLPRVDDSRLLSIGQQLVQEGLGGIVKDDYELISLKMPTALLGVEQIVANIDEKTRTLILPGALTEGLLRSLEAEVGRIYDLKIVIRDGTRNFLEPRTFQRFIGRGGVIQVLKPIQLLAVTVNSTTPQGGQLDSYKLCTSLARQLKNTRILDLKLGNSIMIGRSK